MAEPTRSLAWERRSRLFGLRIHFRDLRSDFRYHWRTTNERPRWYLPLQYAVLATMLAEHYLSPDWRQHYWYDWPQRPIWAALERLAVSLADAHDAAAKMRKRAA
jgi:hypothetical protein